MPLVRGRPHQQASSRPSTSAPTPASASRTEAPFTRPLPDYEPPTYPLAPSNAQVLSTLAQKTTVATAPSSSATTKLHDHLKRSSDKLAEVTENINAMVTLRQERERGFAKRRQRARTAATEGTNVSGEFEGEDAGGEEAAVVEELGRRVEGLTREIEERVRGLVDVQARIEAREKGLREIVGEVEGNGTQSTLGASQFRDGRGEGEDDESIRVGVPEKLRGKIGEWEKGYQSLSMRERYATHNDYKVFKTSLHYAHYPGNENPPPVPHANTWFRSGTDWKEEYQPSLTRQDSRMAEDIESEPEIETVGASINIKCPLTLQTMKDPVTSQKCPHSFEKKAIEDVIRQAPGGRSTGCPECGVMLTNADLTADPVLRRNIQRIQAEEVRKRNADDDDDEDYESYGHRSQSKRAQSVDSNYESPGSIVPNIKAERVRSSMMKSSVVPSTQFTSAASGLNEYREPSHENNAPPPSSAEIVDLGGDGSDDDDESNEEE